MRPHPRYNAVTGDNDIALVQLQREPSGKAKSATLELNDKLRSGIDYLIVGWGRSSPFVIKDENKNHVGFGGLSQLKMKLAMLSRCESDIIGFYLEYLSNQLKGYFRLGDEEFAAFWKKLLESKPQVMGETSFCLEPPTALTPNPKHLPGQFRDSVAGPCVDDAGGPVLAIQQDGKKVLAGVISFGIRFYPGISDGFACGGKELPAVYISVANHREWIRSIIGPAAR